MPSLHHYLILSGIVFAIGAAGVLTRRNAVIVYICIELMLSAVSLSLIAFSKHTGNMDGHILIFMIMTVAAAEAAVGLAIIISIFRLTGSVDVDQLNTLKG